jgi:hypothetical protein
LVCKRWCCVFSGKQLLMAMGYGTVDEDYFGDAGF